MVEWPRGDGRWPKACATCGRSFGEDGYYVVDHERIYRRADTGDELILRDAPVGACWDAHWYPRKGPDGRSLMVRVPGNHDWLIDGRAKNCTLKDDEVHRCWVRHGRPEDGTLHVDKDGLTCAAGAGSLDTGQWHGFLHNGHLRRC